MKKVLIAVGLAALVSSASAQGLINFFNNSATLVTLSSNGVALGSTPAVAGQFYFQLFTAPAGTLTDGAAFNARALGTNLASAGRFTGGGNVGVAGNPAGGTGAILVRGWSASLGTDYATALVNWNAGLGGYLGSSLIAPNFIFGGFDGVGTIPTSPAFGGAAGIQQGFAMDYKPIPEPASIVLAGLGAASLLLFRRRK